MGLGRKLIQIRLDVARNMGLKTIVADTLRRTTAIQALYVEFGFQRTARYPESHAAIPIRALGPEMPYFQRDLRPDSLDLRHASDNPAATFTC